MGFQLLLLLLGGIQMNLIKGQYISTEGRATWETLAEEDIITALRVKHNNNKAKNVLVFIGDGMGLSTVTAARIAQRTEKGYLSFEKLAHIGLLKTYSANKLVPDSASTATAMFSGVKTNQRTAGVTSVVQQNDCESSLNPLYKLESFIDWAQQAKMSTGFVTTTRVTHATPSALYAHTANRYWECEAKMVNVTGGCKDIARQLVEDLPGKNINVIMGGGRQMLQSDVSNRTKDPIDNWACYRKDGKDLIKAWADDKRERDVTHQVLENTYDLQNKQQTEYTLGIFANGHLNMDFERDKGPQGMPSIGEMTTAAINLLEARKTGYILMVEGGLIDYGHHRGKAKKALGEAVAFSDAIALALNMVNLDETLVIVTSDHGHPMTIVGYAERDTEITGLADTSQIDGVPYTTLLYPVGGENNYKYSVINGTVQREDPSMVDTNDYEYSQQAGVLSRETPHDGTDVAIYAQGPMAHLIHSVHEQTYVAYVVAYAAEIGPYHSRNANMVPEDDVNVANPIGINSYLLGVPLLMLLVRK